MSLWDNKPIRIFLISTLVTVGAVFFTYLGYRVMTDVELGPCSPGGFPGRCYYVSEKACQLVWDQAKTTCTGQVQKLSLPVTRLIGPIMAKCQQAALDRNFNYSRSSEIECQHLHTELEAWEMRNPDFK